MQPDISQVKLSGPLQFGSDGYVQEIARPAYALIINTVLKKNEGPSGPSGNQLVLAFVAADRKSVYREVKIFGLGCWMGVVNGLLQEVLLISSTAKRVVFSTRSSPRPTK